jgi:dihydropteroate synthase
MKILKCNNKTLDLTQTSVMGIINATPDSFSDGGKFNNPQNALKRALEFTQQGATILDIGGESTQPLAKPVSKQEEIDRVMPVTELILKEVDTIVSIDTSNDLLMQEAIAAGVHIINDVRSLTKDRAFEIATSSQCAICLMHMKGEPDNMQTLTQYDNILQEVYDYLQEKVNLCLQNDVDANRLIIDPGFGFAKTPTDNLSLTKNLAFFKTLNLPILFGASRKSTINHILNKKVNERLYGSLALAAIACFQGANIIRVHDVDETVQVVKMVEAIKRA